VEATNVVFGDPCCGGASFHTRGSSATARRWLRPARRGDEITTCEAAETFVQPPDPDDVTETRE
jgi:hypothetical protein